jgi:tight adherence protein C
MMEYIKILIQVESIITILIALAAFGTVVTVAAPFFDGDKLKARMKGVVEERERLRAAQRALLASGGESKLRDRAKPGLYNQLVEILNLRKVFEAEASRDALRQAGFRTERHLITYLALRVVVPIVVGLMTFIYTSTVFAESVSPNMRLVATMVGLIFGFYVPHLGLKNLISRRQTSIRRACSDANLR